MTMFAVKFGAEWCGPCARMEPVLADLAERGYEIHDVDVDEVDPQILVDWKVSGVPATFILNDEGEVEDRIAGAVGATLLEDVLND